MNMYPDTFDFYGGSGFGAAEAGMGAAFGAILGFYLVFVLVMMAFSVVAYVLHSLGLYSIAKRRGIHHPWLAWLPFGTEWILGSIGDQYQYVAKGKVRNRRKVLLGLELATYGAMIAMYVCVGAVAVAGAMNGAAEAVVLPVLLMALFAIATVVLSIIFTVYVYIAYYNMFASCNPDNAVVFLVLGIFFPVTMPFFVFACRKQDKGMPPRTPVTPEPAVPVYQEPMAIESDLRVPPMQEPVPETPEDQ